MVSGSQRHHHQKSLHRCGHLRVQDQFTLASSAVLHLEVSSSLQMVIGFPLTAQFPSAITLALIIQVKYSEHCIKHQRNYFFKYLFDHEYLGHTQQYFQYRCFALAC